MTNLIQKLREEYQPTLPAILHSLSSLAPEEEMIEYTSHSELASLFPQTCNQSHIRFTHKNVQKHRTLRIGVVLSGGQAAGGHNVITGLYDALKKLNRDSKLYGFLDGPSGIINNMYRELDENLIAPYRNQGGFDLIGSGRTKIETTEQFQAALANCKNLHLDGLVIIGGDDSNTNAALLAEYFKNCEAEIYVVGVPKTIDGDLKNEFIETSFGFDSACKTYAEILGNLARDSLSAKKYWFFVKIMGRSASHIALECALQTHPNITLIGEEIEKEQKTIKQVILEIVDIIIARSNQRKNYGIAIIPEGIIEFIPEFKVLIEELNKLTSSGQDIKKLSKASAQNFQALPELIKKQLLLDRDSHGNVQVSKIETERLFIELVKDELKNRNKNSQFNPQPLFCGYEGRSCLPSNFDSNYCYALGHVAALLIDHCLTGYMASIQKLSSSAVNWRILGIPFVSMMQMEMRKGKLKPVIRKALVNLGGAPFQYFRSKRENWALEDSYMYPGPIQFFGPKELTDSISITLEKESINTVTNF